jgi:DNA invertase Pin-like site-specific DNA recombinase
MEPSRRTRAREGRAIGYVCVAVTSTVELGRHVSAIRACCADHALELIDVVRETPPAGGGAATARPSLFWSLSRLAAGEAEALISARLDQLTNATSELASIIDWFLAHDRRLIIADVRLDTSTSAGRVAAETLSAVGAWERERMASRTRQGLETARSRGASTGRPAVADIPALQERILRMREGGMTLRAIADVLNEEGVPTVRGGARWRPSSLHAATGYRRPSTGRGIELPPTAEPGMAPEVRSPARH